MTMISNSSDIGRDPRFPPGWYIGATLVAIMVIGAATLFWLAFWG